MAKFPFLSVDDYIAAQPEVVQVTLKRVRSTIQKALPNAQEVVSYNIPAYKLNGRAVIYFAGWKQHFSLYPTTAHLVSTFKEDLAPYELSKGTIRFSLSERVPVKLIERIAKFRAKEVAEAETRKTAKSASPKKISRIKKAVQ
jgi:uncharacterized protein YdhG (YjbR/CyaY superfamily)